jgi:hypothetical protein
MERHSSLKKTAVCKSRQFVVIFNLRYFVLLFIFCVEFAMAGLAQQSVSRAGGGDIDTAATGPGTKSKAVQGDSVASSLAIYPGGDKAFARYLQQNISMPQNYTVKENVTITVTFTIEESGKLSNIQASDGPKPLKKEAIRVIKHSGKWIPAYAGAKAISSERQQRISFFVSQ